MYLFLWILILISAIILIINWFHASKNFKWTLDYHFNGKRFYNIGWSAEESMRIERNGDEKWGFIGWMLHRKRAKWTQRTIKAVKPSPEYTGEWMRIVFIGHATALIQRAWRNILTDPVWSDRASPFSFLGPKRYKAPGVNFEDLPRIDAVLLSHNHYDHMDIPTLKKLSGKYPDMMIYTGLWNKKYLNDRGILNVVDMDWWSERQHDTSCKVTFLPAQHFSARGITDRNKTLWWGFRLEIDKQSLYFAWDTGYGTFIEEIKKRYPEGFDIGLLPIGAYKPRWFMAPVHTNPAEAMQMQIDLGVRKALAIHFGTFPLADDAQDEPVQDLIEAKKQHTNQIFEIWENGSIWKF